MVHPAIVSPTTKIPVRDLIQSLCVRNVRCLLFGWPVLVSTQHLNKIYANSKFIFLAMSFSEIFFWFQGLSRLCHDGVLEPSLRPNGARRPLILAPELSSCCIAFANAIRAPCLLRAIVLRDAASSAASVYAQLSPLGLFRHVDFPLATERSHPRTDVRICPHLKTIVAPQRGGEPARTAELVVSILDHQRIRPGLRADAA